MRRAAAELFGEGFSWDGIEVSGHLDPLIFYEAAALNGVERSHHEPFRRRYLAFLAEELETGRAAIRAMPGVHATLEDLRGRGDVTLGLLTGNYPEAIPLKLAAIGLDPGWFPITAFGDEADSRPALARLAIEKYARRLGRPVDPSRVVVIGDTPRDVDCAHRSGAVAFAVASGKFTVDELAAAGADFVVADLGDPGPLRELLGRLGS
jgi:phosphoglycolate phosphatase-like HAD superfamily hydrolase